MNIAHPFWLWLWLKQVQWGSVAQIASATATTVAVIVALWGVQLRHLLLRPKLTLTVINWSGTDILGKFGERKGLNRWFHLKLENPRRFVPVSKVRVYLLKIEVLGTEPLRFWEGMLQLNFRHDNKTDEGIHRDMGHSAEVDLCVIRLGEKLQICTKLDAAYGVGTIHEPRVSLRLYIQARGIEGDSDVLVLDVDWDGAWPEDRSLMARHVSLRAVPNSVLR